jgi:hypothetical protein
VLTSAPPLPGGSPSPRTPQRWTVTGTLRDRRLAVRRRRLVLRMRDWLGITVITAFSVTLFALTIFSLLGH